MVDEEIGQEDIAVEEETEAQEKSPIETEMEELRKLISEKAEISDLEELKSWKYEALRTIEELRERAEELRKEDERILIQMREFTDIITQKNEEMKAVLNEKVDESKIKMLRKDMAKMNKKLGALMEETGFGEIIDVTKIPPNILEIVYDTTLKDISLALWREYGPGAEGIITETLEKIRLETSGSEMFHYDGRYIVTRDVAKNIKRGMISAKQLQDTYEALLKSLSEHVPAYRPKNFKAMIKLKSQEYTVDKTTHLLEKVEKIEESLAHMESMLSSAISGLSSQARRMSELEESIRSEMEERLVRRDAEIEERFSRMEGLIDTLRDEHASEISSLKEELASKEALMESLIKRLETLEGKVPPGEDTRNESQDSRMPDMEGLTEEERLVLSAIGDGTTYARLKRSAGKLISSPLDSILDSLIKRGLIHEEMRGKSRKIMPSESTPNEEESGSEDSVKKLLDAIPDRGCTLNRLKKALGKSMDGEEVERILDDLVEKEVVVKTARGRYTIYVKNKEKIGGEKDA